MGGDYVKTLIKNVNVVTPYEILYGFAVALDNSKIVNIDKEDQFNEENFNKVIEGKGNFLSPGFIDIHNHGNSGYDIMDSTEEALDAISDFHLKNGVTSYLGTVITSSYEDMIEAMKNIVNYKNKEDKAQIIGIHLEGPFFNIDKKGAQPAKHIKSPNLEEIENILKVAKDKLKMVSLAPELEGALDIINFLKNNDVTVAMAHTNATYEDSKKGIAHGITVATHLYNGMRSFSHREPGVIGASLTDDRVYCEIIYDRIHLHDAAVEIAIKMKGQDKIVLVSDAMRATGLADGNYELGGQKVIVKKGAARLESGNLAGSTLNLRKAVYNMVSKLNIPIHEAVRMASLSPAKAIKVDNYKGSIEIGKDGDLIIFDKDININTILVGGNVAWERN
nr:N-acetylglucosamine-6-phosphate deacetylase [Tissierella simiarum]